jgi:trimeric autotransporter adhesin
MKERLGYVWGCLLLAIAQPVEAQPNEAVPIPASTKAADLVITPRVGVGYTTPGGGYDGFANIQGFIPLMQTPGKDLLFLEGRFLLDNDANPGGSLVLGYRAYQATAKRIYGAYLAYDNRDTGSNVFSQVGLGLETLGEGWDARINGYIPAGNTRQTVRETTIASNNYSVSSTRFQANSLLASGTRQQLTIRDLEAAMAGFDAEIGGRLVKFPDDGGDLRGYGGLYYLSATGSPSVVGVRGRLEARVTDNLLLGVAVQHDGLFGTNVFGTIALTLPGVRPKGAAPKTLLARMAESPTRIGTIAIDQQRETTNITVPFDLAIENPATGQPYVFQHVTLGVGGGNGTFENPFGVMQSALDATQSDGNAIVYVQAGSNPGIPAFTIRDRVQVLSTFPTQIIPAAFQGQRIADVRLDLSGVGAIRPTVNGTITMGSDTVLSGFDITSATGAGVTFNTVRNVEIRDNAIANTADSGILGNGVSNLLLLRNQINRATNQGIYIQNTSGTVNVLNNQVGNTVGGTTTISNPITNDLSFTNPLGGGVITIPNPGSIIPLPSGQGIVIVSANGTTNILDNAIANTATQGLVVLNATGNLAIANNAIANTIGTDVAVPLPTIGTLNVPSGQGIVVGGVNGTTNIFDNTISNTRGQGLTLIGAAGTVAIANNTLAQTLDQGLILAGTAATVSLTNNRISDVGTRLITTPPLALLGGIALDIATGQGMFLAGTTGSLNISNNIIERVQGTVPFNVLPIPPGGQGLVLVNFTGQLDLTLSDNQIRNNYNDGVFMTFANTATATVTIRGNTIENNGILPAPAPIRGDGIAISAEQNAIISNLLIENNLIQNNGDDGIDLRLGSLFPRGAANAQVTGTIRNNTVTINATPPFANAFAGIQVEARGTTQARVTIENNTVNANNPAAQAINLQTFGLNPIAAALVGGSNPLISANVRFNILTGTGNPGFRALTGRDPDVFFNVPVPQTLCVNLNGNTSLGGGYTLANNPAFGGGSQLQVVLGTNTGAVNLIGTTPVAACP